MAPVINVRTMLHVAHVSQGMFTRTASVTSGGCRFCRGGDACMLNFEINRFWLVFNM